MAQLYFYYSAMNAGKSTALLQSSYNYQERGMRTVVYTAEIDDRFGAGKVSSRIGLSSPAKLFNQNSSLFDEIRAEHEQQAIHCVLVDECQFLTRHKYMNYRRLSINSIYPYFVMVYVPIFEVNYLLAANTYWHGPTNWLN